MIILSINFKVKKEIKIKLINEINILNSIILFILVLIIKNIFFSSNILLIVFKTVSKKFILKS